MKKLLVCPKNLGNTYNVCDYVAKNLDVVLEVVNEKSKIKLDSYDVVVITSGVYMNHVHKNILRWLNNLPSKETNPDTKFYLFLTWFGRGKSDKTAYNEVEKLLATKNIKLELNYASCFGGGMGFVKSSHPDEVDCNYVLSWTKEL